MFECAGCHKPFTIPDLPFALPPGPKFCWPCLWRTRYPDGPVPDVHIDLKTGDGQIIPLRNSGMASRWNGRGRADAASTTDHRRLRGAGHGAQTRRE